MHCPGQEAFIATLHPTSALFERPVHLKRAKQAHRLFQQTLRAFGLNVRLDCETDPKARRELEDFAVSHLQYVWAHNGVVSAANAVLNPTAGAQHGPHGRACFIDEHYKRDVIRALDSESLVNLLLCNPTIILQKANRETPVTASYILYACGVVRM
ncbi:arginine deiminase [Acanthamoeba castellanii str. Neff]|uniref:Arginine deiminase n=1 Tax=Acanthamoeba castellanii (strain ATCC 30010 / Neff) TaxID=1257118 RepID=L8H3W4_ACACF|nr:arginine deiminase [Acanthamoeba castellanii str. Neff]ELR19895.1 arginine deiminase [Acanthamoeba castellanii str. Neff]